MMQKVAVFSGLIISATCMVLHQQPIPLAGHQYDNQNYNFAYNVNDAYTGDIKNQHESKQGDTVLGQYSLIQPDGVRRTVDYRADDHSGFHATVNNNGRPIPAHVSGISYNNIGAGIGNVGQSVWPSTLNAVPATPYSLSSITSGSAPSQSYPWPNAASSVSPTPVAVSRTSIYHTVSSHGHNSWA